MKHTVLPIPADIIELSDRFAEIPVEPTTEEAEIFIDNPYFANKNLIVNQTVHDLSRSEKMLGSSTSNSMSLEKGRYRSAETKKLAVVCPDEDAKDTTANKSLESKWASDLTAREVRHSYPGRERKPHFDSLGKNTEMRHNHQ